MTDQTHPSDCSAEDPIGRPFEAFLDSKAATGSNDDRSGKYVSQLERVVGGWIDQMSRRGVETFDDLDGRTVGRWTDEYLTQRVRSHEASDGESGVSPATANVYYDYVSAYLEYCRKWEIIDENPAATAVARDPLPERPSRQANDQQFWTPQQRMEITRYVRRRASEALDEIGFEAVSEIRDYALIYTIGYSGARGSEILRVPRGDDQRRTGATWEDVNLEEGTLQVLGKSQDTEQVPLTDQPIEPLRQLRDLLNVSNDQIAEWPIFPTFHSPTLWVAAREQLQERGHDDETTDELLDPITDPIEAYRQYKLIPPSLTTEGARNILKRFTADAGIDVDGKKEYLTLHGARRGVGEQYYREVSPSAAQRVLRHADPRTTSKMYSRIEASELSDIGSDVFDNE